jgi:2-methylisocitrate lyase-like PEP mutase family enzyme
MSSTTTATSPSLTDLAKHFRSLHQPSNPLILTNVHDTPSATLIASLPQTTALASASYAVAESQGVPDAALTLDLNLKGLAAVRAGINAWTAQHPDKLPPLTADLQDGYDDPAETVKRAIETAGIVGCNIEDLDTDPSGSRPVRLRSIEENVARLKSALKGAEAAGVPAELFTINARTDVLGFDGTIDDCIERGLAYLQAGAACVFVWGVGKHVITKEEAAKMAKAFDGRLSLQPWGGLGIKGAREAGASRVSTGPYLWRQIKESGETREQKEELMRKAALEILEG